MSPGAFTWYIRSIYSGKVLRKGARGWGHALSYSGWRSSLPVGSSSSLRLSAAAQSSPELSAAGHSPYTGYWSTRLLCHSCSARKIQREKIIRFIRTWMIYLLDILHVSKEIAAQRWDICILKFNFKVPLGQWLQHILLVLIIIFLL